MNKINKQEFEKWKKQKAKLELTNQDLHNLYDLLHMSESIELKQTLLLNDMLDWYKAFFKKVEKVAVPELYEKEMIKK